MALAAVSPANALLVLAGIGPVVTLFSIVVRASELGIHCPEALGLAFIAGASARRAATSAPVRVDPRIVAPAVILIAAALASAFVQAAVLAAEQPDLTSGGSWPVGLIRDYLVLQNRFSAGIQFAEGLLLFLLSAGICAGKVETRERVIKAMLAGATGAALMNVLRLILAALRVDHAGAALIRYFLESRINVQYSDWNAAGSYFAMMLVIAIAFAARRRLGYIGPACVLAVALWMTGSRAAMAAALLVGAVALVVSTRAVKRPRLAIAVLAIAIVTIGAAGWLWYPAHRNDPAAFSIRTRLVLWRAGISMMATNPVFGIGVGGFYERSHDYAPEMLEKILWRPHENAHNYFVQVLAELGIPGLLLFASVIGLSLQRAWRSPARDAHTAGIIAGLATFLLTAFVGHPFLILDAAYPFWIALGMIAAETPDTAPARLARRTWIQVAATAAILVFVASVPVRARIAVRHANLENTAVGLSGWRRAPDGQRFRWASSTSAFFVPSTARSILIPLRPGPHAPSVMEVDVLLDDQHADRVQLHAGEEWRNVRLARFRRGRDADFVRIELRFQSADPALSLDPEAAQILMVGSPSLGWGE
jgi:O-antigen ligase